MRIVLGNDVSVLGNPVLREESIEIIVSTAGSHLLELEIGPGVHGDGSDEADVNAEAPVLARALETHEDAVGDGRPLGILLGAVHADLVSRMGLKIPQNS